MTYADRNATRYEDETDAEREMSQPRPQLTTDAVLVDGRRVWDHRTDELESILATGLVALGSGGTRRVSQDLQDVVAFELEMRAEPQF